MPAFAASSEGAQTVGGMLQRRRQELGHDLAHIAQELCIREHYLAAIEANRADSLPGTAYAVGFVRAYADALGLNAPAIAERFRAESLGSGTVDLNPPSPLSEGGIPKGAMILVGAAIVSFAYGIWYVGTSPGTDLVRLVNPLPERYAETLPSRTTTGEVATAALAQGQRGLPSPGVAPPGAPSPGTPSPGTPSSAMSSSVMPSALMIPSLSAPDAHGSRQPQPATPAALPPAAQAVAPPAAPQAATPEQGTPGAAEPPAPREAVAGAFDPARLRAESGTAQARVVLRARSDCWIEIKDETSRKLIFAKLLRGGETYDVPDRPGLKLLVGNAGGLDVVVDAAVLPPLGRDGAVMRNIALEPERLRATPPAPRGEG